MTRGVLTLTALFLSLSAAVVSAENTWEKNCARCHRANNRPAPSAPVLTDKYKTPEALVSAALQSESGMMKRFKDKKTLVEDAAQSLYGTLATPPGE